MDVLGSARPGDLGAARLRGGLLGRAWLPRLGGRGERAQSGGWGRLLRRHRVGRRASVEQRQCRSSRRVLSRDLAVGCRVGQPTELESDRAVGGTDRSFAGGALSRRGSGDCVRRVLDQSRERPGEHAASPPDQHHPRPPSRLAASQACHPTRWDHVGSGHGPDVGVRQLVGPWASHARLLRGLQADPVRAEVDLQPRAGQVGCLLQR